MAAEMLAGGLPGRISGPVVVVVAGPVVVDATVVVVGVWLVVVGTRVVVVGPVVGGMLVVGTMLVVVARVVVGAAVVAAVVSSVVVASEGERAVPVVALPTLAGAGAVAGRAVVGLLVAPCSGPGVVEGAPVGQHPNHRARGAFAIGTCTRLGVTKATAAGHMPGSRMGDLATAARGG